jgi:hypothetical protein
VVALGVAEDDRVVASERGREAPPFALQRAHEGHGELVDVDHPRLPVLGLALLQHRLLALDPRESDRPAPR